MSCAVMFQPQISGDSLRQRFYQHNDREIVNDNACNISPYRSSPSENNIEKYKPHYSCLANTKMVPADHKHLPGKHNNVAGPIPNFNEKDNKNLTNYVLVKNYAGDVETVVDEHFSRALDSSRKIDDLSKERGPPTKNFPPSYYQPFRENRSAYNNSSSRYHPYYNIPASDYWSTMSSQDYKTLAHRGMYSDTYPQFGASFPYQYAFQSLQPSISKMSTSEYHSQAIKPEGWTSRHYESVNNPYYQENAYEPTYISPVHHGIESSISQEHPKDLYWL